MASTSYVDFTAGLREIPNRTDAAGVAAKDLPLREDALVNEVLTAGVVKPDGAFAPSKGTGDFDVDIGSGSANADVYVVVSTVTGQPPYLVQLKQTSLTVTLDAADADARIDEVYLVVRDDGVDSNADGHRLPRVAVRKGDASTSPVAPGPDSEWVNYALLASVSVAGGAPSITASDITDERVASSLLQKLFDDSVRRTAASVFGEVLDARFLNADGDTATANMIFESGVDYRVPQDTFDDVTNTGSWPNGRSLMSATTSGGSWPGTGDGIVYTWNHGNNTRSHQLFVDQSAPPQVHVRRRGDAGGWTAWRRVDPGAHIADESGVHGATDSNTGGAIVRRSSGGRFFISEPLNESNASTKRYTDDGDAILTSASNPTAYVGYNTSVAGGSYHTIFDITGGAKLLGGSMYGYRTGVRLTIDGTVVLNQTSNADGADVQGDTFSAVGLPAAHADSSMKLEVYNSSTTDRRYGWQVWTA